MTVGRPLPVFPRERTSSGRPGTSEKCHERTHAPQQMASLAAFDCVSSRYGFLRKLDRNLSANQTTKIAANDRQKYIPVHKRAFPAVVIALSLASKKDRLNGTIADNRRTDVAINQFGATRLRRILLHRDGLAPSTPCRSPGALRSTPKTGHRSMRSACPKSAILGTRCTVIQLLRRREPPDSVATQYRWL